MNKLAKVIAICGKICSGKSHYAKELKEKEKAVILSCDELCRGLFDEDLGEKHDETVSRIQRYLRKKAIELVSVGCNVILDWGFWSAESRISLTAFFALYGVPCQWHYLEIDDQIWQEYIALRNRKILNGEEKEDYYVDDGLLNKFLQSWEAPSREEIHIWHRIQL